MIFFPGKFFPWSCLFLSCQARSNCIFENFSVFDYLSIRLSICVSVRFKLSLSTTVWTWAFWVVPMNNSVSIVTLTIISIFSNYVMKFSLPFLMYHKTALKFREGVFGYQVSFSFSFQLQLVFFLPLFFVLFLSFFLAFIQCVCPRASRFPLTNQTLPLFNTTGTGYCTVYTSRYFREKKLLT